MVASFSVAFVQGKPSSGYVEVARDIPRIRLLVPRLCHPLSACGAPCAPAVLANGANSLALVEDTLPGDAQKTQDFMVGNHGFIP